MAKKAKCYAEGGDMQEYEGDDISALTTAKQRMAERDAEYAARQAAEEKPPAAAVMPRRAKPKARPAPVARPTRPMPDVPPFAEEGLRRPAMTAPAVQAAAEAMRRGAGAMGRGDMRMGELQGRGLRGLGGGTQVPGMKKGGVVKKMARGGGCETRGKTRGRMV